MAPAVRVAGGCCEKDDLRVALQKAVDDGRDVVLGQVLRGGGLVDAVQGCQLMCDL